MVHDLYTCKIIMDKSMMFLGILKNQPFNQRFYIFQIPFIHSLHLGP